MKSLADSRAKEVAARIRKIREFRNYTQEYLAMKLDISQNAYSKIELGYCSISLSRLFHIAMVLEVEISQLLAADEQIMLRPAGS